MWRHAKRARHFRELEAARGDKLRFLRGHRVRLPLEALLEQHHFAGVLQSAEVTFELGKQSLGGRLVELLIGRERAGWPRPLPHPANTRLLLRDRKSDRLAGEHDAGAAEQSIEREAADMQHVSGRN
jgi:hypothetical protein